MAEHGNRGFIGSVGDLQQVALSLDGKLADTRMPFQGTPHIQHSKAAEKAVDLEAGATQPVGLIDSFVRDHMHIRSYH